MFATIRKPRSLKQQIYFSLLGMEAEMKELAGIAPFEDFSSNCFFLSWPLEPISLLCISYLTAVTLYHLLVSHRDNSLPLEYLFFFPKIPILRKCVNIKRNEFHAFYKNNFKTQGYLSPPISLHFILKIFPITIVLI